MSGLGLSMGFEFPSEPPVVFLGEPDGAERARARWARRSFTLAGRVPFG